MLQSISGHSSEQSIANMSSRPTVLQLKCVTNISSNWFKNHQTHKTNISTVTNAPFIQNSNKMPSRLTATTRFARVFFSTPAILKATSKLFGSQGCSDDKNWLDFSNIFLRFVDFAVQFCFRYKFSFNKERSSRQVWQSRDFSRPIKILCYA